MDYEREMETNAQGREGGGGVGEWGQRVKGTVPNYKSNYNKHFSFPSFPPSSVLHFRLEAGLSPVCQPPLFLSYCLLSLDREVTHTVPTIPVFSVPSILVSTLSLFLLLRTAFLSLSSTLLSVFGVMCIIFIFLLCNFSCLK